MEQIWITGAGIISSIGIGKEETCRSLLEERSGIGELKYLKTEHHEFPVGEVKLTDDEMCQRLNIISTFLRTIRATNISALTTAVPAPK